MRELVGAHIPGAEQLGFADVLKHWEFDHILMEDIYWRTRERMQKWLNEAADPTRQAP